MVDSMGSDRYKQDIVVLRIFTTMCTVVASLVGAGAGRVVLNFRIHQLSPARQDWFTI